MKYELSFRRLCRVLALANEFVKKMGKNKSKRLVFEHFLLPVLLSYGEKTRRKERADGAASNFFLDRLILPLTSTVLTNGIRMTLALLLNLGKRFSRVIFTENRLRRRKSLSNNAEQLVR